MGNAFPSRLRCTPLPILAGGVSRNALLSTPALRRLALGADDEARPLRAPG